MLLEEIENYAKLNHIPIMEKDGIMFLKDYIKKNNIKKILEIGSAIGYSAIQMALVDDDIYITTIERDSIRYEEALRNISKFNLNNRIEIICDDAFNVDIEDKYDLIFIDAAKAQSQRFFEKFQENLEKHGTIITDNINFHGLTNCVDTISSRNLRSLVRKINAYVAFLKNNAEFETIFYDVGDGIAVSKRN